MKIGDHVVIDDKNFCNGVLNGWEGRLFAKSFEDWEVIIKSPQINFYTGTGRYFASCMTGHVNITVPEKSLKLFFDLPKVGDKVRTIRLPISQTGTLTERGSVYGTWWIKLDKQIGCGFGELSEICVASDCFEVIKEDQCSADDDIRNGMLKKFSSVDEMLVDLKQPTGCTCSTQDLMAKGCTCGYWKKDDILFCD